LGRRQGRNFSGLVFDSDSADAFDAPCMRKRRDSVRPIAELDQGQESKFPGEQSGQGRVLISGAQGSVVNRKRALFHGTIASRVVQKFGVVPGTDYGLSFLSSAEAVLWPDFIIYRADFSSSASLQCRLAEKRIW
jgi:hypothetical protein